MTYPFDLKVISSLKEYLDHKVIEKLGAWRNEIVSLYEDTEDDRLVDYVKYTAGPQQWVYDSSIAGADIASPTGFIDAEWKTAKTDFRNARFILPIPATGIEPTFANVALKHFNSYISTKDDEELYQNTMAEYPPEMNQAYRTKPDSYHAPCYFVKFANTRNEGFAMGGLDRTFFTIKITCFAKTEAEIISLSSIFRDLSNTSTMVLNSTPLDEFNDLKTRPWSFHNEIQTAVSAGNEVIHIDSVTFNTLKSDNINSKLKNIYVGIANVSIFVAREPRA